MISRVSVVRIKGLILDSSERNCILGLIVDVGCWLEAWVKMLLDTLCMGLLHMDWVLLIICLLCVCVCVCVCVLIIGG